MSNNHDEDEIELHSDEKETEAEAEGVQEDSVKETKLEKEMEGDKKKNEADTAAVAVIEEMSNDSIKNSTKKSKLQERLRKLQLKINQSKTLNHQQVIQEGERLSSKEAYQKHRKDTIKSDKKKKEQEQWENIHSKNVTALNGGGTSSNTASKSGKMEIQALVQSGNESLRKVQRKSEKFEQNLYSTNDHYNPQGQFRNYESSLKSVASNQHYHNNNGNSNNNSTTESIQYEQEQLHQKERNGAKRLANELKRRAAKSEKRKQKEMDFEAADVSHINKRNKHFNEKISRNYDKHTAEIRQNLERGTAL
jgi:hypothetical protein